MSVFPIVAKVHADTSAFIASMAGATGSLTAFAGASGLAGKGLGVLAGAAGLGMAISSAREYQAEMLKLNTLVGIQTNQVEAWDSALKDLATQTGKAPADLARAMFAITSGGARGQEALDILEQAAKSSAIGLGDMTSIGRTATAMLQAFGDEGLTAEKAIDILVATVREGNLEAESLAGGFSRLLGPAKILGSSVEDIGGFLATFTRLGGSTEQAATGLLNVFNLLIKPPTDARAAMVKYGTSIEKIRKIISEDGLNAGLAHLNDVLGDNVDAIGQVIPNSRSLIGFLNTANLQSEQYAITQGKINDSLGTTSESFITWGESADASFKLFVAGVQTAAVEIGENLLPPLTALLKLLGPISKGLRLSAEGWDLIGQSIANDPALRAITQMMAAFSDETEGAVENYEILDALIANTSMDALAERSSALADTLTGTKDKIAELKAELEALDDPIDESSLTPKDEIMGQTRARQAELDRRALRTREIREELDELSASEAVQLEHLTRVNTALRERRNAEEEANDAAAESVELTQEQIDAEAQRLASIQGIIDGLEEQRLGIAEGMRAVLSKNLTDLEATEIQREMALALYDEIQALNETADATRNAERERERATAAEIRRRETLSKQIERDRQSRERAVQRTAENEALAKLQNHLTEVSRVSTDMATTVVDSLLSIQDETVSTSDAFRDMVNDILKQIQRLLVQKLIVEPIVNAAIGHFAPNTPSLSASDVTEGVTDFGKQLDANGIGANAVSPSFKGSPSMVVVQQSITFAPSLIDGASGERFIKEQGGAITQIIGEAAQQSGSFAATLGGR